MSFSPLNNSPLEVKLGFECFKRYLQENPQEAIEKALTFYEDFSLLRIEHKKLKADLAQLQEQPKSPQIPSFLPSNL